MINLDYKLKRLERENIKYFPKFIKNIIYNLHANRQFKQKESANNQNPLIRNQQTVCQQKFVKQHDKITLYQKAVMDQPQPYYSQWIVTLFYTNIEKRSTNKNENSEWQKTEYRNYGKKKCGRNLVTREERKKTPTQMKKNLK